MAQPGTYAGSNRRRMATWVLLAMAAVALLTMRQVDGTLAQVPDADGVVHVVADLTGPTVLATTPDVGQAIALWSTWDGGERAITTSTIADLAFVLAGMVLVGAALHRLGARRGKAALLIGVWAVPDALAASLLWLAVRSPGGDWQAVVWVARCKWLGAIALVLVTLGLLVAPGRTRTMPAGSRRTAADPADAPGLETNLDRLRHREAAARSHRAVQSPLVALRPLGIVVGLFLLLVALPLGGPLDQFPDVFRRRIDEGTLAAYLPPLVGLGLALAAVVAGGFRSIMARPPADRSHRARTPVPVATIMWVAIAWAVAPHVVGALLDSPVTNASLAPLAIIGIVALTVGLRTLIRDDSPLPDQLMTGLRAIAATLRGMAAQVVATVQWLARWMRRSAGAGQSTNSDEVATGDDGEDPPHSGPPVPRAGEVPSDLVREELDHGAMYVAALAGVLVLGGGLGPLRALLPMWIVSGGREEMTLVAMAIALVAPAVVVWLVTASGPRLQAASERTWPFRLLTGALVLAAAALAAFPFSGPALQLGVLGITSLFIAAIAAIVGGLVALGRHGRPLPVVSTAGAVTRTPWFTIIFVVWVVAGMLDTQGGYHAVRIAPDTESSALAHEDWQTATDAWMAETAAWARDPSAPAGQGDCDGDAVPMVFVAAPGGGIRAAYWTASVLDELEAEALCGPAPIFAVAGVSGGSVGTATWLSTPADASEEVARIADEAALAATVAGLFGRDALVPFHGITQAYDDRAALLERGWEHGWEEDPTSLVDPWVTASGQADWAPISLLHGSSSTTGCRTVVTNAGRMGATDQGPCLDAARGDGPLEATATLLTGVRAGDDDGPATGGQLVMTHGLRSSTAALLSARFPVVSPSALVIGPCGPDVGDDCTGTHYVVDGGYYENTGLLSIAELLPEVEAWIAQHGPAGLPDVETWVVIANNAAPTAATPPGRPNEILLPLTTKLNSEVLSPTALTQGLTEATDGRIVDVRPGWRPAITPPLGWSLSPTTMCEMDRDIAAFFTVSTPNQCDEPGVDAMEGGPAPGEPDDPDAATQPAPTQVQRSAAQEQLRRLVATGRRP